jgi:hypothetical protein
LSRRQLILSVLPATRFLISRFRLLSIAFAG